MPAKRKSSGLQRHQWTARENNIYLKFIEEHQAKFADAKTRKSNKVFLTLSRLIKTRQSTKVKSHHQKLMEKYGSIPNIIAFLKEMQEVFDQSHSIQEGQTQTFRKESQEVTQVATIDPKGLSRPEEGRDVIQGLKTQTQIMDRFEFQVKEEDIFEVIGSPSCFLMDQNEFDSFLK